MGAFQKGHTRYKCVGHQQKEVVTRNCTVTLSLFVVNSAIVGSGLVATGLSFRITTVPKASNLVITQCALVLSDLITDFSLILNWYGKVSLWSFWGLVSTEGASLVLNTGAMFYVFKNEETRNPRFAKWRVRRSGYFASVVILAALDMQIIYVIDSKVFNMDATNAGLSFAVWKNLNLLSTISVLFENVPQLVLKVLVYMDASSHDATSHNAGVDKVTTLTAIALSTVSILSAIVGMLFALKLGRTDRDTDLQLVPLLDDGLLVEDLTKEVAELKSLLKSHGINLPDTHNHTTLNEKPLSDGEKMYRKLQLSRWDVDGTAISQAE